MQRKLAIVEEIVKGEAESQELLLSYPNETIEKLAGRQLKGQGELALHKATDTLYFGETCNDYYHGYGLLIYRHPATRFYEGSFQNNCKYGYGL